VSVRDDQRRPVPDQARIARFVVDHERALAGLLMEGLRLCAAAGLVDLEVLAPGATKLAADAALDGSFAVGALIRLGRPGFWPFSGRVVLSTCWG